MIITIIMITVLIIVMIIIIIVIPIVVIPCARRGRAWSPGAGRTRPSGPRRPRRCLYMALSDNRYAVAAADGVIIVLSNILIN